MFVHKHSLPFSFRVIHSISVLWIPLQTGVVNSEFILTFNDANLSNCGEIY